MNSKKFASAILLAQKLHEESWDEKTKIYQLTNRIAATIAVEQLDLPGEFNYPIYLLNTFVWNDIQDWAEELSK